MVEEFGGTQRAIVMRQALFHHPSTADANTAVKLNSGPMV
jgi:hypothetical protein